MKKRFLLSIVLVLLILLSGCKCQHQWQEASCDAPKTCTLCQEVQGEPAGHSWAEATCETPKTCTGCGITEGEPTGHTWLDATCTTGKKCSVCGDYRGEPLDHDWEDATTEAPKICKRCNQRSGSKLDIDPRFSTPAVAHLLGKWKCDTVLPGIEGYLDEIPCTIFLEFTGKGWVDTSLELHDQIAYMDAMVKAEIDLAYALLESEGYNREEADALFVEVYGMPVEQYFTVLYMDVNISELFDYLFIRGVYYANEEGLYTGANWKSEFILQAYTLEDGVLILDNFVWQEDQEPPKWTRVEE